jgi:hypothetical protein
MEVSVAAEHESRAAGGNRAQNPRPGFADIARRITSRTTDLIAIAIVVVASLTFGRQVLQWWHAEAPQPGTAGSAPVVQPGWEDQLQPVSLEFGDLPLSMTRQTIVGNGEAAVEALIRHCERSAAAARSPWREWDQGERQLLARTEGLTAVAEETDVWQVYVIDRRFPMVAGVRRFVSELKEAAFRAYRLVCWGMAMPAGENAWNLFVFQGVVAGNPVPTGLPSVPLPPGGRRNLSLRDERGGMLVGFSGNGSPPEWMKFYDDWFTGQGWSSGEGWFMGGGACSARFHKPGAPQAARVEVQFAEGANRELTGLLQIVPPDEN